MIPILFDSTETEFTKNGIGRLDEALSCIVTEDLVGVYELELTYPVEGRYANELISGGIISALRPYASTSTNSYARNMEQFIIYKTSIENKILTVNAHHISYELAATVIQPSQNIAANLRDAVRNLINSRLGTEEFDWLHDVQPAEIPGEFRIETVKSFREYLYDDVYSLKKIYDVDIWFKCGINSVKTWELRTRGEDRGAEIRPGKNLSDWTIQIDASESYNAIVPYWQGQNENGQNITVFSNPKVISPSPAITPTIAKAIDFSSYFETAPTQSALTTTATNYLNTLQPWEPYKHIEVGFYHDTADADLIDLGDTVTVYLDNLENHREKMRIVSVKYDSIMEKFVEIELGDPREGYAVTSSDGLQATRKNMA